MATVSDLSSTVYDVACYLFPPTLEEVDVPRFLLLGVVMTLGVPLSTMLAAAIAYPFPPLHTLEKKKASNIEVAPHVIWNNFLQWNVSGWLSVPAQYLAFYKVGLLFTAFTSDSYVQHAFDLAEIVFRVLLNVHAYDLMIYGLHRASHEWRGTTIYHGHKKHHENNRPASFWHNIYGDLVEGGTISCFAFITLFFYPNQVWSVVGFYFIISVGVALNHTGRDVVIPYLYSARFHQQHHVRRDCNFCEHTQLWDRLFGTYVDGTSL